MAQTYTENCFAVGNAGLTDLQNMEDNFHALKTMFSGSSAPSNSTGGMPWFDTGKKLLKIRNSTNGAWIGILSATTAPRFWLYGHNAEDGWLVDTTVADRVVAIKGGSAAYNANGGTLQGAWTVAGLSGSVSAHNHLWYDSLPSSVSDGSFDASGNGIAISRIETKVGLGEYYIGLSTDAGQLAPTNMYTANSTAAASIASDASWRPAAAVGTLQYLDI